MMRQGNHTKRVMNEISIVPTDLGSRLKKLTKLTGSSILISSRFSCGHGEGVCLPDSLFLRLIV